MIVFTICRWPEHDQLLARSALNATVKPWIQVLSLFPHLCPLGFSCTFHMLSLLFTIYNILHSTTTLLQRLLWKYYVQNLCKQKSFNLLQARRKWISLQFVKSFLRCLFNNVSLLFLSVPLSLLPLIGGGVNNCLQCRVLKDPFPLWEKKIYKIV